ncbi:hypothetical protein OF83DRAFT_1180811 [Amylostereum chailletii]|nr:hypothetical protein OF83DRAFT_1180811 [Amylostereum chailletii]
MDTAVTIARQNDKLLKYLLLQVKQSVAIDNFPVIMHFDPTCQNLRPWCWPVTPSGMRVPPSEFHHYRAEFDFCGPCCLCSLDDPNRSYVECAQYMALDGELSGKYVVGCATNTCGYKVDLEKVYRSVGTTMKKYAPRGMIQGAPGPLRRRRIWAGQAWSITQRVQSLE